MQTTDPVSLFIVFILFTNPASCAQVRAAVPMYLLARRIKAMGFKVVLSGEGADEVFGGYLYFHKAPSPAEFHKWVISAPAPSGGPSPPSRETLWHNWPCVDQKARWLQMFCWLRHAGTRWLVGCCTNFQQLYWTLQGNRPENDSAASMGCPACQQGSLCLGSRTACSILG